MGTPVPPPPRRFNDADGSHPTERRCPHRGKALQESLVKLVEACGDESHNMDRWLSKLENSKWLSHVQVAMSTAGLLAECVER